MNKTDMLGSQDRDKQLTALSEALLAACVSKQQVQHEGEQSCSSETPALQEQKQPQQQQKHQHNSPRGHGITVLQTSAVSGTEVQALLQWLVCNSL